MILDSSVAASLKCWRKKIFFMVDTFLLGGG
jgi:hypothetical protein